jgi:hypothetical protein
MASFTPIQIRALRLMKRRFRPVAVDRVLGLGNGDAGRLRYKARLLGWTFPALPKSAAPLTAEEYRLCCRAAGVEAQDDVIASLDRPVEAAVWPHLIDWPESAPPRNATAGRQAARIARAAAKLRYVPPSRAGGGELHFGRECAEHLARLIAYAPGPRYPDDPRGSRREPLFRPQMPDHLSLTGCALADLGVEAA